MPGAASSSRRPRSKIDRTLERRGPPVHAERPRIVAEPERDAAQGPPLVPKEPAAPTPTGYRLLTTTVESAKQAIEANALRLSLELVGLQRKAIDSVHEAAIVTLHLAEAISHADGPAEAADACLRHGRERAAALNGVAFDFFRSALNLIGALSLAGVDAALDRRFAIERTGDADDALANRVAELTTRQRNVLRLLLAGLPNKLIAHEMGICETTVKAHVSQVLMKFNVYSRARIIALLGRYGDIEGLN